MALKQAVKTWNWQILISLLSALVPLIAQENTLKWVVVDTTIAFPLSVTATEARNQTLAVARQEAIRQAVPEEVLDVSLFTDKQAQTGKKLEEETAYSIFALSTRAGMIIEEKVLLDEPEIRNKMLYYHLRLQAAIQPVQGQRDPSLDLELKVNDHNLQDGEKLKITVRTNRDGYLYIFDFLSDNSVQMLFPNGFTRNNAIKAKQEFTLPTKAEEAQGIAYKVVARKDVKVTNEVIYAVFSLMPIAGWEKFTQVQQGYVNWSAGDESFAQFQRWLLAVPLDQRIEREVPIHIIK